MTVEADLKTEIGALVSGRCYPDVAPTGATLPFATYQQAGGEVVTFINRETPSKKNGRFGVWVWATTRATAQALMLQVENALILSTRFQALPLGAAVSERDQETGYYGARQDFSVWSER